MANLVNFLLDLGGTVDINRAAEEAANHGHIDLVYYLIELGANSWNAILYFATKLHLTENYDDKVEKLIDLCLAHGATGSGAIAAVDSWDRSEEVDKYLSE